MSMPEKIGEFSALGARGVQTELEIVQDGDQPLEEASCWRI